MKRRNILKLVPAAILSAGGIIGFSKFISADSKSKSGQSEDLANSGTLKKMITKEELATLERNPETITPIEMNDAQWREVLDDNAYAVLRKEATERPFSSPLDNEKRTGQFVCGGCGLALFESNTKFDSRTGWPSFYDIIAGRMGEKTDWKIGYPRTEYHCARCGGHQGHVFKDGPKPTGLRYCNNGLALKFIPEKGTSTS